jgi:hypothetical protein
MIIDVEELKAKLNDGSELHQDVLDYIDFLERKLKLLEKIDMVMKTSYPEQTGHYFISGELGDKDQNGLPEYVQIVPAYGVDWHMLYKRDRSFGPEW